MSKQLKCLGISMVLALLLTGLSLFPSIGNAEAATASSDWKRCGQVSWAGGERLLVEASDLRCGQAMEVARSLVGKIRRGQCENAVYCTAKGFACPVGAPGSGWLRCHKDNARVRMRINNKH